MADARSGHRQFNAHDADTLLKQNNKLLTACAELSARTGTPPLNVAFLETSAQARACCQILVEYGVVSEAEMGARVMLALRATLTQILQQYEETALQQAKPTLAVAHGPLPPHPTQPTQSPQSAGLALATR